MFKKGFSRRRAIGLGLGTLATLGAYGAVKAQRHHQKILALDDPNQTFNVQGLNSLKQRAAAKGILFGSAARHKDLTADAAFASRFAQECGVLVPEWELKWAIGYQDLRPAPQTFNFSAADWMADYAQKRGLLFRGHPLIWFLSMPEWFKETVNAQNAEQFLISHIQTVAGHYAGRVHSWDVVNEAVETSDRRHDHLRNISWLDFLGPRYINLAFQTAAAADPNALLIYNDYGLEYDWPDQEAKRTAVLKFLEGLKSRNVPIHGLGIQAHLTEFGGSHPEKLRRFLKQVADLGLQIFITELDVIDKEMPSDLTVRDRMVAGTYESFLSAALDEPAVTTVILWALSDRHTWVADLESRPDKLPVRPHPLDANLKPKLAWNAIARAFDAAPRRSNSSLPIKK